MATTFTEGSSARAPVPRTTATSAGGAAARPEPSFAPPLVPPSRRRPGDLTEAGLTAATWVAQAGGRLGHWHANVHVEAYRPAEGPGTPWLFLRGPGWRRLPRAHEHAGTALAFLGAQAFRTGRPVSVCEDGEGVIRQIYLW
ncbi:hypothetical protein SAMN05421678_105270 [Actinopolymorpha cephalotaxi]|uniref:Uncharacterized protein n=1 Tax=Actinopolymorpha cephalotaxi TaxID=504797 RepID=A0A1I2R9F0_9ACTN|nr:hypothetical protein [Actinopolymorpha cephalotaxi]NYH82324.1 hypothetical protein [Actinopolymorpha cephalotaxi]SFG36683.1 hypothetical protein SAMN05421678_105270 [Actinopolymorpha cephalotaxi]